MNNKYLLLDKILNLYNCPGEDLSLLVQGAKPLLTQN